MYCIILPIYICLSAFNLLILPITKNIIMANQNLGKAKKEKKDEFYTQLGDINKEMQAYLDYNPDVFPVVGRGVGFPLRRRRLGYDPRAGHVGTSGLW